MNKLNSNNRTSKKSGANRILNYALPIAFFTTLIAGAGVWFARFNQVPINNRVASLVQPPTAVNPEKPVADPSLALTLTPAAKNWQETTHVHGLAINSNNPEVAYIATHHGLLQRSENGQWFWMGKERADYMGFTADPTSPNRFFSSGHPPTGGNLGFQISNTQGEKWQQISMPGVDFHALAIAPSNPQVFYGYPASGAKGLRTSTDGGKTWTQPRTDGLMDAPFSLVVDPSNPVIVFATTRTGLYKSTDSGNNWTLVPNTQDAPVVALALLKEGNSTVMYGYRFLKSAPGLYRSKDNGMTWDKLGNGTNGVILQLAIAPSNSQVFYAVNENNAVFQSQDGGRTWQETS